MSEGDEGGVGFGGVVMGNLTWGERKQAWVLGLDDDWRLVAAFLG